MGEFIGYARASTIDQDPALQLDALNAAGCAVSSQIALAERSSSGPS